MWSIVDKNGNQASIDYMSQSLEVIDYTYHIINEGTHYYLSNYQKGNANGDTIDFTFEIPSTNHIHFWFKVYGTEKLQLDFYRGTSSISGGTGKTPINNNERSNNTSSITVTKDPTIGSDGSMLFGFVAGGNKQAGTISKDDMKILEESQNYLIRITSLVNANDISWDFKWHEMSN